jgi:hypothetical protein
MTVQAARQVGEDRRLTGRGGDAMKGPWRPAPKVAFLMTGVGPPAAWWTSSFGLNSTLHLRPDR